MDGGAYVSYLKPITARRKALHWDLTVEDVFEAHVTARSQLADRLLFALADLPLGERESVPEELLRSERLGRGRILVVEVTEKRKLCGAMVAWILPGKTATVWPPHVAGSNESNQIVEMLGRMMDQEMSAAEVHHVQALVQADLESAAEKLAQCGFEWTADLLYLICGKESFERISPVLPFEVIPIANRDLSQLVSIVEATYDETLDCPALNGLRPTREVLAGYRATGEYRPDWWFVVEQANRPIGCLLLADYPQSAQVELVYFGLVPGARGQGFGEMLVRYAQFTALAAGREQLVLAVDTRNRPAIDAYFRCGFEEWGRRSVWLKVFRRSQQV